LFTEQRTYPGIAKLSFIEEMAKSLLANNIMAITGLPGSGKTCLSNEIVLLCCQNFPTGANIRHINDIKELEDIPRDKEAFLLLDEYIKSWFSTNTIHKLLTKVKKVVNAGKMKIFVLICVPDNVSKVVEMFLKNSSIQHEICDLHVQRYTEEDWRAIFNSHMRKRKAFLKDQDFNKYREAYIM
jgi:adenylate kinase family enzyme